MAHDDATVLDMLKAARLAVAFKKGMRKATFMRDAKTQSAVLHQLLVFGEAAKRLSSEFRTSHPEVPWKQAAGMRDQLIHEYDDVDLDKVWKTLTADIPPLIAALEPLAPVAEE
jgi:uncharacterized protein with HEPN domain